jgi:hypothetical protein
MCFRLRKHVGTRVGLATPTSQGLHDGGARLDLTLDYSTFVRG